MRQIIQEYDICDRVSFKIFKTVSQKFTWSILEYLALHLFSAQASTIAKGTFIL